MVVADLYDFVVHLKISVIYDGTEVVSEVSVSLHLNHVLPARSDNSIHFDVAQTVELSHIDVLHSNLHLCLAFVNDIEYSQGPLQEPANFQRRAPLLLVLLRWLACPSVL